MTKINGPFFKIIIKKLSQTLKTMDAKFEKLEVLHGLFNQCSLMSTKMSTLILKRVFLKIAFFECIAENQYIFLIKNRCETLINLLQTTQISIKEYLQLILVKLFIKNYTIHRWLIFSTKRMSSESR